PLHRAMRGEIVKPEELLFRHADGREVPVLVSAAPVHEPGFHGSVVLFEDISALKHLQSLREEWAALVAHELRQPLTVLRTSVGLLEGMTPSPPDAPLFAKVISRTHKAAESLTRLIDDLTEASRIESRRLDLRLQLVQLDVMTRALVEELQARSPN